MASAGNPRHDEKGAITAREKPSVTKTNPVAPPSAAEYERAKSLVTDEELQRAADEPGGCSTEELLEELRGM